MIVTFACHHNLGPPGQKAAFRTPPALTRRFWLQTLPLDLLPAPSVDSPAYLRGVPTPERVAVLLNAHARRVTPSVLRALSRVVPRGDLYVSRSPLDARRIAHAVVEQGYHTVFLGGGDGTFVGFADEVLNLAARRRVSRLPHFGILKL